MLVDAPMVTHELTNSLTNSHTHSRCQENFTHELTHELPLDNRSKNLEGSTPMHFLERARNEKEIHVCIESSETVLVGIVAVGQRGVNGYPLSASLDSRKSGQQSEGWKVHR